MSLTLIKNCRLIKELTDGYQELIGDVLIKDDVIKEISKSINCEDARVIDIKGQTLLPGLIDLHTHFVQWNISSGYEALTLNPCDAAFRYYNHAMKFLKQGYTTVRDCGSDFRGVNYLAKAIANGIIKGPRVISPGLIITPTETGNQTYQGMYNEVDGVDEVTKACREEFKHGAMYIKIMMSGAFMNAGGIPIQAIIYREEIAAAVSVAKMKDSYVGAHCHSKDSILMAIEEGVRTIEHGSFLDDKCIDFLKDSKDTFVVPTLSTMLYYENGNKNNISSPKFLMKTQSFENLTRGFKAGLKYGWGTDITLDLWNAHPGYEFKIRSKYFGCSNIELLKQATIYSAGIAGIDDITGSIAVGKKADLISINGNPDKDLDVMSKPPTNVWSNGELFNFKV